MKIEAYQCEICEKIYKTKKGADNCNKRCQQENQKVKARSVEQEQRNKMESDIMQSESLDEIVKGCIEYQNLVAECGKLESMVLDVRYVEHASNSHSRPMSGVSNFTQRDELPTGYPALRGRVKFLYSRDPHDQSVGSNICRFINTGTGGGGSNPHGCYELDYDVTLWLDDFPKIKTQIENTLKVAKEFHCLKYTLDDKLDYLLKQDKTYQENIDKKLSLESEIVEIEKKINKIRSTNNEIYLKYKQPLFVESEDFYKSIDNPYYVDIGNPDFR